MVKEEYVSVEVAKLLEEKGFYGQCHKFVKIEDMTYGEKWNSKSQRTLSIPTQQMVMRWLREVHNFHITIMFSKYLYGDYPFYWSIDKMVDGKREHTSTATADYTFKSYEKTADAAIKYCLENLIKEAEV